MPTKKLPKAPPGMVARWEGDELIVESEPGLTECGHSKNVRCSDCGKPKVVGPPSPAAITPEALAQAMALLGISPTEAAE